jgi:hypothetical protein
MRVEPYSQLLLLSECSERTLIHDVPGALLGLVVAKGPRMPNEEGLVILFEKDGPRYRWMLSGRVSRKSCGRDGRSTISSLGRSSA